MKSVIGLFLCLSIISALLSGCGGGDSEGNEKRETGAWSGLLAERFDGSDLERNSDIRIFKGEALWEYINGGADVYHTYNFIEVATADYKQDNSEFVADVYRFQSPEGAYGMYTRLRPPDVEIVDLATEGFVSPGSLIFTRGESIVRLTGYDRSDESALLMNELAVAINRHLTGVSDPPPEFGLLPAENRIPHTEVLFADSFLEKKFLSNVYGRAYESAGDTVVLFFAPDEDGAKFQAWSESDDFQTPPATIAKGAGYERSGLFSSGPSPQVPIVAGLKGGRLAGMIHYSEKHDPFLSAWLGSLPERDE